MKVIARGTIVLAVCALVFGMADAGTQVTTGPLYGIDRDGPLYTVDEATGEATLIGPGAATEFSGLEYDPSAGVLYAGECTDEFEDVANLWSVDPETGVATVVGPTGIYPSNDAPCITGLAMDGSGTLYGVYENGVPVVAGSMLVTFSKVTGAATDIGQVMVDGPQGIHIQGLAFHPTTGVLYGTGSNGNLYTIDPTTAAATPIGATNVGSILFGLAFGSDGTPYATSSSNLYTLDLATGAATLVGSHDVGDGAIKGLAYNLGGVTPPPPTPSGPGGSGSASADAVIIVPRFTG